MINNRSRVRPRTRARVAAAISELERQEAQLTAPGATHVFRFCGRSINAL
ncbi:hypothetical protein [Gymnodinialimonas sp. 57CJ19]